MTDKPAREWVEWRLMNPAYDALHPDVFATKENAERSATFKFHSPGTTIIKTRVQVIE